MIPGANKYKRKVVKKKRPGFGEAGRGAYENDPDTGWGPEPKKAKAQAKRRAKQKALATPSWVSTPQKPKPTVPGLNRAYGSGVKAKGDDLGSVLETLKDAYKAIERDQPGAETARNFVKDEAKNLADVAKDSLKPRVKGSTGVKVPNEKELSAGLLLASTAGGASAGEKALSRTAKAASDASWAKTAAKRAAQEVRAAPKRKVAKVKSAPKRTAKAVKDAPKNVKAAPRKAKKAVATKEGRRAAAKGTGRKVATHPVRSFAGAGVLANQANMDIPGLKQAGAFVEGTVSADPIKSAKTTARAVPGIVTGPAALLGSAASSVASGSTKPLEEEFSKQWQGMVGANDPNTIQNEEGVLRKLFSGDPKKVKRATEDEVGYSFVVPLPAASKLRKTAVYKGARGKVRAVVDRPRARKRGKVREEIRQAKLENRVVPRKLAKKGRKQAVIDSRTGDAYILPGLGRKIENRRGRIDTSRELARVKSSAESEARRAQKRTISEIRKSPLSKGEHNVGDVLATVAQYGISRKRDKALRQLDDLERSIRKDVNPDSIPTGIVNDLANIRWIRENADAFFKDKHFWRAVDEYKARAKEISTSKRKENLAVGDVYGVKRPEERMAEAGVKPYKQLETIERKRAELREVRQDAKRLQAAAAKASPEERALAQKIATEMQARAKVLERDMKTYRKAERVSKKEYNRDVQAVRQREGLEPSAYVRDVRPRSEGETLPAYYQGKPSSRPHMADIEQARRGVEVDRSFDTLIDQSVGAPRLRDHYHAATTNFVERNAKDFNGQRYITSEQFARAVERGEVDPSQFALMPAQQFKRAVLDPHKTDSFTDELNASLRGEIQGKANQPGNKYAVVPKEALREFIHQFEPPTGVDKALGPANRFFTRAILGYSPGWAAAQVIAEGIPTAISVGTNPARWARVAKYLAREERRLSRKDKAVIDGTVGESPGVTPQPKTQLTAATHANASRFFRLANRNPVGRGLLKAGKGEVLGGFDRWKGGKYRKAVAAAKVDREINGFYRSLSELMKGQRRISEALKGKPLKAQMEYIAKHPAEAAKLEGYLDNVMGNWRAMTRLEAKFAPAIVFYPFVRYSLRWTFWTFPKEHPVKAQILYFLAQQNSNELEKLLGGPPVNPIDYTFPVYTNAKGQNEVMPGGQRFAPGMNALTTAIGKGRIETTISGLNPALGLAVTAGTGIDPFTGEKVASSFVDNGLLALNQLLSMPAPLRAPIPEGVPVVGGSSIRDTAMQALGKEPPSDIAKAFRGMDPNREARSFFNPLAPQSAERYRDSVTLSKSLEESGWEPELGEDTLTQAVMAARKGDRRLVKQLIRKRKSSEKAGDEIGRLVRKYVSDPEKFEKFTKADWKVVNQITGQMVIPVPSAAEKRREEEEKNPFGLPSTDASDLRKEFGLPSTSASDLRKQFGLE